MNKLLALGLLFTLPTLAAADVEGMVLIEDAFYIDRYEYPNQRGTLPKVNVTWGEAESLCAERRASGCVPNRNGRKPALGRKTSRTPTARNSSRDAAIRALPSLGSGSAGLA